jgi:enoyl-CoA hydratase
MSGKEGGMADRNASEGNVIIERQGPVLLIGLNRPAKKNAWDKGLIDGLFTAYTALEDSDELRVGVVHSMSEDFTAGVDLDFFASSWSTGHNPLQPKGRHVDPLGLYGRRRTKPVISAVQGRCYTIGIELMLATDIRIAAQNTRFAQMEVQRGLFPGAGATVRLVAEAGWGNAMRWLLTGDEFSADEAWRIGLVQEVLPDGHVLDRCLELANTIARAAPLGVRAVLESARRGVEDGYSPATLRLFGDLVRIFTDTDDAREGIASFRERRRAMFRGS